MTSPVGANDQGWSRGMVLVCLGLILALAFALRARGLGVSVYGDEAYHFAVADREAAGQGMSLAPHFPYRRALWFSEAVIASRHLFGDEEWAHRIPAFVASLGSVLLIFAIGRRWFDATVGLLAALVLALDQESVFFGSYARFYSTVQLLAMLAVYSFDCGVSALDDARNWRADLRAVGWACLFVVSLAAGLLLQVLSASVVLGAAVFVLGRAAFRFFKEGRRDWWRWPETWLLGAGVVMALLGALFLHPSVLLDALKHVPLWNTRKGNSLFYYASHLRTNYPFEFLLAPVGALYALWRWPRGAMAGMAFFVPAFIVHSVLPQKVLRYIFLLVPYFLLFACCGYVFIWRTLRPLGSSRLWRSAVAAVVLIAVFFSPSSVRGGLGDRGATWVDWRAAVAGVKHEVRPTDAIVAGVGDDFFAVQQYTGRVDAHICTPEWWRYRVMDVPEARVNQGGPYGIPCLNQVEQFEDLARQRGRVWIFLRSDHLTRSDSQIAPRDTLQTLAKIAERKSRPYADVTVLLLEEPR